MTEPLKTVEAYVRADNTVTIVCPACKVPKNTSAGPFLNKCHQIKVRCPCQNIFKVSLNFRQFYRKSTELSGIYTSIRPAGFGKGIAMIKNISLGGMGIIVEGQHNIEKNHRLQVSFELDDKKRTKLSKEVIVMSIDGNYIGCRFTDNQAYEKELGFYLKS